MHPSASSSVCLYVCLSVSYLYASLLHPSYPPACMSYSLSVCLPTCLLSTCQSVSFCLPFVKCSTLCIRPSVVKSVCLPICVNAYFSVCLLAFLSGCIPVLLLHTWCCVMFGPPRAPDERTHCTNTSSTSHRPMRAGWWCQPPRSRLPGKGEHNTQSFFNVNFAQVMTVVPQYHDRRFIILYGGNLCEIFQRLYWVF